MSRSPSHSARDARPVIAVVFVALTATGIGLLAGPSGARTGPPPGGRSPGTMPPGTNPGGGPPVYGCERLPPANPRLTVERGDMDLNLDGVVDPLAITPVPGTTDRYV